ncbi:MAG: ABC transporter substrate-binding protein [Chloroflexi bacterium]|nr:ABC transporter substrate-binding protein [Chloroflexota bacterium]
MHPYIPELKEQYRQGKISRREFAYWGSLLGLSMGGMAAFVTACGQQQQAAAPTAISVPAAPTRPVSPPTVAPTTAPAAAAQPTKAPVAAATAAPTAAPQPTKPATTIKRGGTLNIGSRIDKVTNPWAASFGGSVTWIPVAEYITRTDPKNITHPWLLESWEPSADLKTWTLKVRKGVKWNKAAGHSGRELNADDIVFTIKNWLDPKVGSSAAGLMQGYLDMTGIEKVDNMTVRLNLKRGEVGVPEHLFHWTSIALPVEYEGDWLKQPFGTGPFTLEEYLIGERARHKRRTDYWRQGEDGKPQPYLDEIKVVDYGDETATLVASLASGQVDFTDGANITSIPAMNMLKGFQVLRGQTSQTTVFRFRADQKPWDDVRVRNALKWSQDRALSLKTAHSGYGSVASDTHVAPIHPEYSPMEPWKQDTAKAKALLAEAGYPNGVEVTLDYKVDPQYESVMATILQREAAKAGIKVTLRPLPATQYWDKWLDVNFGLTSWTHRPIATMVLALAYVCGAKWNESHWCDKEFESLLNEASSVYDLEKRRAVMAKLQKQIQENGAIHIPFWRDNFRVINAQLKGIASHPSSNQWWHDTWWDK